MQGLALTNDIVFKLVFGTEKREAILRGLLNAILTSRVTNVSWI